jgi:FMN-dependent NADH-azoreductase
MATMLHIDASARRKSFSREVGNALAMSWRAANPGGAYVYRDLAADPVPQIGEAWTQLCDYVLVNEISDIGRYHEAAQTPAQKRAWGIVEPLLAELVAADVVLIATPMYNYSIPASLKAWIDQVTFPKMSLAGRKMVVAYARGGAYGPDAPKHPYDHQQRYLQDFFAGHFAIDDPIFLGTEMVNATLDPSLVAFQSVHDESRATALATASSLGVQL